MNLLYDFMNPVVKKIGFEDVLPAIKNHPGYIIINTLSQDKQSCLIYGTIPAKKEEEILNGLLEQFDVGSYRIIVYGQHSVDDSADAKYRQLKSLGFEHVYVYGGGLFEWLLLQEVYGAGEFKTQGKCSDILSYRVPSLLSK